MRRDGLIQFRVSAGEKARIAALAAAAGQAVGPFVRGRALGQASGSRGGPPAGSSGDEAEASRGRAPAPARASGLTGADAAALAGGMEVRVTRTGERMDVREVKTYRCPRGCDAFAVAPRSPAAQCPACRRPVVPV